MSCIREWGGREEAARIHGLVCHLSVAGLWKLCGSPFPALTLKPNPCLSACYIHCLYSVTVSSAVFDHVVIEDNKDLPDANLSRGLQISS